VKNSRFTESQIFEILTVGGAEILVAEVFRKHGISAPTYYQ
jgi:putative transposase